MGAAIVLNLPTILQLTLHIYTVSDELWMVTENLSLQGGKCDVAFRMRCNHVNTFATPDINVHHSVFMTAEKNWQESNNA